MEISPDIRKRFVYSKYLLDRAAAMQRERGDLGVAVSLLLMHDATEMLMLAIADHLQLSPPKKWDFMDFWGEIKKNNRPEPPSRIPMERLNSMRVGLKHKGNMPHPEMVRDLMPRVETFFEHVTQMYFDGLDFVDLGLADLVENSEARNLLCEARQAFASGDRTEAFVKLRRAFDTLEYELEKELPLIEAPPPPRIPRNALPDGIPDYLHSVSEFVQHAARTLNVLMLGVDPIKYTFFLRNTPLISYATHREVWQAATVRTYDEVPEAVFQTCFDFVVDFSLRTCQLFRSSNFSPEKEDGPPRSA